MVCERAPVVESSDVGDSLHGIGDWVFTVRLFWIRFVVLAVVHAILFLLRICCRIAKDSFLLFRTDFSKVSQNLVCRICIVLLVSNVDIPFLSCTNRRVGVVHLVRLIKFGKGYSDVTNTVIWPLFIGSPFELIPFCIRNFINTTEKTETANDEDSGIYSILVFFVRDLLPLQFGT
jgi:hypothetical protein